ncbi:uncharacterized protein LOC100368976 isoform X2 [Saccoglossus kowalevskii]|uniref:Aprataxin and PNK-like factor-like isoform X1 n=1 Tax=Saccoglossus kowalevskii TaxID=10224 RepID=A0ABM0GLE7_SACKO|nr:PREDICTED: aprataxin and PNK-like factor-like isoform X1 [Saccoglossus kowalevskii]
MSGVVLRPCTNTDWVDDIPLPPGQTILGRGPFLGISDKRVSRSHAILEVDSGKLRILPTHINPTFHQRLGTDKLRPLAKDEWQELKNGEKFSLIPEFHIFKVVIDEKPINNTSSNSSKTPVEEENGKETITENKKTDDVESDEKPNGEKSKPSAGNVQTVKLEDKKEVALPVQRERKLPSWILNAKPTPTSNPTTFEPRSVAANIAAAPTAPRGRGRGRGKRKSSEDNSFEEAVAKKPAGRGRGRKKKVYEDAYSDEDDDELPVIPRGRARKTSDEDFDLDWMISDDNDNDDDNVSDWEEERKGKKTPKKKSTRRRSSSIVEKKTPPRRAASRRTYAEMSDSDDEIYEEDLLPARPSSGRRKKQVVENNAGDDDDDSQPKDKKPCPYGKECYRKNPGHFQEFCHPGDSDYVTSQSVDDDEAAEESLPECPYGTECYRKNKAHLKEYKHTKNPTVGRPKRKAAEKKSVLDGASDDESQPNTYNYDDSFIDDEGLLVEEGGDESSSSYEQDADSDWEPDTLEKDQVKDLVKEARGFVKNKKMQKKV